ncbi:bifunctional 3-(3-hydroxy-phenyl)propionate/3-hydroxycinnamic acid hydroxylase [Streptomyces catenulae]|uniref:Bifunctional 3-(3-hydroxy-phenyl)propionate/3-hydroxycinnamic acid hydroxylase n=1 Tax=Streptomyces catenulae TaxID=66875 RepID=A0ABV2Z047_9ACTN|nr:bifunctional 3-(3-hydroxy-phenyl)propionate/3-hydroxycinnamic acid hydroxylase [Streptomyces catenulae]
MTHSYDADVALVGYGPTGVIAALTLARNGVSAMALERDKDLYPRARAVTVDDWTMRIFQDLGIDERVEKKIEPQRALRWITYDGTQLMRVDRPRSELGCSARAFNIYQPTMEAELRAAAQEYGDRLTVRYGAEVTELTQDADGVTVTTEDTATGERGTVRARYAICADGGSSTTRGRVGCRLLGDTGDVTWVVIDCRVKRWWPDRDTLTFWSDRERPVVDIPLSAGNHRWEIPLLPHETPADYPTSAEVWPLLEALGVTPDDVEIHQHAFYKHHVRMADTWRSGRVFLAGDAAHLMPPWAGAGMQTGIRDAHDLGWKLARVLKGELPASWLDTYETERRPSATFYTELAVALGQVIKQEVTGVEPPLNADPLLRDGWLRGPVDGHSIVGRMVPQPVVGNTAGRTSRLDTLLGSGFALLGDDTDPAALLTPEEKAAWDALGARYLAVRPKSARTQGPDELVDLDEVLLPWLRGFGVRAVAVRPDKFVAAADTSGLAVPA